MLKYKSEWVGRLYIEINRFFPYSKTCSNCLHQLDNLSLDIRSWQCPKCQTVHDRDMNAAMNIRDEGLRLLAFGHLANASFQPVRLSKSSAFRGNVGWRKNLGRFTAGSCQVFPMTADTSLKKECNCKPVLPTTSFLSHFQFFNRKSKIENRKSKLLLIPV